MTTYRYTFTVHLKPRGGPEVLTLHVAAKTDLDAMVSYCRDPGIQSLSWETEIDRVVITAEPIPVHRSVGKVLA